MAYVSTKCLAKGRHCDCVTGPTIQSGGVVRPNRGYSEFCTCQCHHVPGATREMFDRAKMDKRDVDAYMATVRA